MAGKANFTSEEWVRVAASPLVAVMAITAADPSGLWGLLKEAFAGNRSLLEAQQNASANPLVKAVAEELSNPGTQGAARERMLVPFKGARPGEMKSRANEELRAVAALVDTKAPADAAGFKAWLQDVAQNAAEAGTEGGFLGFGGVAVSDAEKAALSDISSALGTSAGARAGS